MGIELMCLCGFSFLVVCQFACVPICIPYILTLLSKCCPCCSSRRSVLTSPPFERQAFQFMQLSLLVSLYNQLCLNKSTARFFLQYMPVFSYLRVRRLHWRRSVAFLLKSFKDLQIINLGSSASPHDVFQCESLCLPNGSAVLPNFAANICVFPGSKMACILSFPFLPCLPSKQFHLSMELLFYNDLFVLSHATTAQVCIFSCLKIPLRCGALSLLFYLGS